MVTDRGVRVGHLLGVAVVVAVFAWTGLRLWSASGRSTAGPSWLGVLLLGCLAGGVYWAGTGIRRALQRRSSTPLNPLRAARVLVLAQAASLTGAAVVGWSVAHALTVLPDADVESQRDKLWVLGGLAIAGTAVCASGLLVQRMCRLDDADPTEERGPADEEDPPGGSGSPYLYTSPPMDPMAGSILPPATQFAPART